MYVSRTLSPAALCFTLALSSPSPARAQGDATLSPTARVADLALLWQEVNYNFVHFHLVPDLDWNQTFEAFVPEVLAARTDIAHVRVLQHFIALLREGHSNVVPTRALWRRYGGMPALELDDIEGRPVVVNTSVPLQRTVPVGSVVLRVNGFPADRFLVDSVLPYISAATDHDRLRKAIQGRGEPAMGLLVGEVGTRVTVEFETGTGAVRTATLERVAPDAEIDWARTPAWERQLVVLRHLAHGIVLLELNGFHSESVMAGFGRALAELLRANGVIIDVRKNGGGNSSWGLAIARHFVDTATVAEYSRAREHVSAFRAWGRYANYPAYRPYADGDAWRDLSTTIVEPSDDSLIAAPVAVLVGSGTYSAAEDFMAFMRVAPRAFLVGHASAGSTGQPLILRLGSTAFAAVTAKRDLLPDGSDIVGHGVQPDIPVDQTIAAFREGRDLVLERAVAELEDRIKGERNPARRRLPEGAH